MPGDPPDRFSVDFTGVTLLGVYRVEAKLAEGGMGSIYRATDTNLERPVVIKVPHPRFLGEAAFRERFSREVEDLIRLEHPHVARILARGKHEDVPFYVLQYLGGGSLEDRIRDTADRPTDPTGVLDWLDTVAETLDYVHDCGIIHRDIKPANILFDETGNVFLSDFGVAKVCDADGGITGSGVTIGSPLYMAPEQAMGRDVTGAADQYALASTVYEALAGRSPFGGKRTPIELIVAKDKEKPTPLSGVAPEVPDRTAAAVMTALERDASARFPSCGAFAEAYRAGLEAPLRRLRRVAPWIAIVVLLLGVLGVLVLNGDAPDEPDPVRDFVLLDTGAEPREALRYRGAAGTEQKLEMSLGVKTTTETPGEDPTVREPPPAIIESACRVLEAGEAIPLRWTVTSGPRRGATATARLTPRGLLESVEIEDADESLDEERGDLHRVVALLRQLPVPLPEEPIGVGATWVKTESVGLLGSTMVQTTRYQLVKRDGDRLEVRVSTSEVAPPQEALALGPGLDLRIATCIATGHGTTVVDLGKPLPVKSEYGLTMELTGEMSG